MAPFLCKVLHPATTAACLLQPLVVTSYQTLPPLAECSSPDGGTLPTTPLESPESGLPGQTQGPWCAPVSLGTWIVEQRGSTPYVCRPRGQGGLGPAREERASCPEHGIRISHNWGQKQATESSPSSERHTCPHGRRGDGGIQDLAVDSNPGIDSPLFFSSFQITWL